MRVAVLASGRGSNMASLLAKCAAGLVDARVEAVLSDRADAACLEVARAAGVPAVASVPRDAATQAADHDARLRDALVAATPDLVVLAGYMRIVGPRVLAAFPGRIINIHPSLLPAFPGAHGVRATLRGGARLAGCTTHIVTADLDGGPILLQAALAVRPDDDEASLAARVLRLEHLLLPRTVQLFAEGRIQVQASDGRGRAWIGPGPSWLRDPRVEPVAGALYSEGF